MFRSSGLVETKNGYKGVVCVGSRKKEKNGGTPSLSRKGELF